MKAIEVSLTILFILFCIATIEFCPWLILLAVLYFTCKGLHGFYSKHHDEFIQIVVLIIFGSSVIFAIAVFTPLVIVSFCGLIIYLICKQTHKG